MEAFTHSFSTVQKSLTQKRLQVYEKRKVVSEEAEHLRQVIYLI